MQFRYGYTVRRANTMASRCRVKQASQAADSDHGLWGAGKSVADIDEILPAGEIVPGHTAPPLGAQASFPPSLSVDKTSAKTFPKAANVH